MQVLCKDKYYGCSKWSFYDITSRLGCGYYPGVATKQDAAVNYGM